MSAPVWSRIEPLEDSHELEGFVCGRPSVDTWLKESAQRSKHMVSTFVCVDETGAVRGFFALKTIFIPTEGMTSRLSKGATGGHAAAVLLAQMGVQEEDHGSGQGRNLLSAAMDKALEADAASRLQLFIVDAADEDLVSFYEKFGMARLPNTLRLAATISAVRKARESGS